MLAYNYSLYFIVDLPPHLKTPRWLHVRLYNLYFIVDLPLYPGTTFLSFFPYSFAYCLVLSFLLLPFLTSSLLFPLHSKTAYMTLSVCKTFYGRVAPALFLLTSGPFFRHILVISSPIWLKFTHTCSPAPSHTQWGPHKSNFFDQVTLTKTISHSLTQLLTITMYPF